MDIAPTSTNIPTPKSPEPETETPTRIHQPTKPLTFTNGVLKRHNSGGGHHHHHHHPVVVSYKECLKNHAATLGGHALDGCGEFMSSPTSNPSDPTSLKCAACGCHRNFHRREPDDSQALQITGAATAIEYQPHHRHHPPPPPPLANRSPNSSSPPPISSSYYPSSAPHMLLALSGSHPDNSNNNTPTNNHHHHHSNNHNHHHHHSSNLNLTPGAVISSLSNQNPNSRKRFRTKFSQYQKDKMLQFAERVGWKMQKRDEDLVHSFCNDVGVDKNVFKVWMHNNKNHFVGKTDHSSINGARSGNLGGDDDNSENHDTDENNGGDNPTSNNGGQNLNHHHHHHHQNQHHGYDDNNDVAHVGTNGSSSSS